MRQTTLEAGRAAAESSKIQAMIGGLAVATMLAGGYTVAQSPEATPTPVAEAHEYGHFSFELGVVITERQAELRHMLQRSIKLEQMRRSVPLSVYTAATTRTNHNLAHANQKLEAAHIPPMDATQAASVAQRLHFQFTPRDKAIVAHQATSWAITTPDSQIKVITNPEAVTGDLLSELAPQQEAELRGNIVDEALKYVGVHEAHDNCNCGPGVNAFTLGHRENWCADWYAYVYKQVGLPFTGGETLGGNRPDWQLGRVLYNPRSPKGMSLQVWFKQHGDYFTAKDRLPKPGDALLQDHHVRMVVKVLPNRRLKTVAGNAGDAVRIQTIEADDASILGFGSVFKR